MEEIERHRKTPKDIERHRKTSKDMERHGKTWKDMERIDKNYQFYVCFPVTKLQTLSVTYQYNKRITYRKIWSLAWKEKLHNTVHSTAGSNNHPQMVL